MKKYIVFTCDNWHTHASKDLIAVCSSLKNAIKIIKQQAKKYGEKINSDDLYNLNNIKQTQNYEGEGEFLIEEYEQNTLY